LCFLCVWTAARIVRLLAHHATALAHSRLAELAPSAAIQQQWHDRMGTVQLYELLDKVIGAFTAKIKFQLKGSREFVCTERIRQPAAGSAHIGHNCTALAPQQWRPLCKPWRRQCQKGRHAAFGGPIPHQEKQIGSSFEGCLAIAFDADTDASSQWPWQWK